MKKPTPCTSLLLVAAVLLIVNASGCKKEKDPVIEDLDGNVYSSVTIDTQTWFVENLKTTRYNDGSSIPNVTGKNEWDNLSTDAYCWYNNDVTSNKATYGALYNWYAVNTGKLCPAGWHVPTAAEWTVLIDYVGDQGDAGGKLKETGTTHWVSPNTDATDQYGFKALPGGDRFPGSGFEFWGKGEYGAWWTGTPNSATHAYYWEIYNNNGSINDEYTNKKFGFSVKCIKD